MARTSVRQGIEALLYVILAVSVFLFGAGFATGYTLLQFCVLIMTISLMAHHFWMKPSLNLKPAAAPIFILTLWLLFLAFQFIPLPISFVRLMSPNLISLYDQFAPHRLSSGKVSLSLGSYSMWVEFGKIVCYVSLFLISNRLFRDKSALKRLGFAAMGIGVCLSLVGLLFWRWRPEQVYGVFSFERAAPFTPYVNKNHFANYLVMTLPVTAAVICFTFDRLTLHSNSLRSKLVRLASSEATGFWIATGAFIIQFATFFAPVSRGGLLGLLAAAASFGLLVLLKVQKKMTAILFIALSVSALSFGIYQTKPLLSKLRVLQQSKTIDDAIKFRISNWRDASRMFSEFPISGIGLGGYSVLFPKYQSLPEHSSASQVHFYHAENELLETLTEQGVAGTSLVLMLIALLFARFYQSWRLEESKTVEWLSLGLACGSIGMLVHSLVDFTLHVPSNVALFTTFAGALSAVTRSNPKLLSFSYAFVGAGLKPAPTVKFWIPAFAGMTLRARLLRASLKSTALAMTALFVIFAGASFFLWHQWRSDRFYSRAIKEIRQLKQDPEISLPSVRATYQDLVKAKQAYPNQARIQHSFGQICFYLSLFEQNEKVKDAWLSQSETAFRKAFQLEPLNADYVYSLGWLLASRKDDGPAAPYLKQASLLAPQNPFFQFEYGKNQWRLKKQTSALLSFQETLKINLSYQSQVSSLRAEGEAISDFNISSPLMGEGKGGGKSHIETPPS